MYFYIFSSATLNETFTVKYQKSEIYTPKPDTPPPLPGRGMDQLAKNPLSR